MPVPPGPASRRKLACLTGFMGSGKTTVGKLLAAQLAWHFLDLDQQIEEQASLPISEIFSRNGEVAFRDLEHQCLVRSLGWAVERSIPLVFALGGGTFAQPRNVAALRDAGATVLWLDCSVDELLNRCVMMADRPLFRDEQSFRKLYEDRLPFYLQADHRIESADSREAVEHILKLHIFDRAIATEKNPSTGSVIA
ncbi:MAG: shikimate kinase [Candidatus Acidiferrales bacterium]